MSLTSIFINDNIVHEYDCDTVLSEEQSAFLDRMDQDMARGIKIHGKVIEAPDARQRSEFVALNLIRALKQDNSASVAVSCAYLCKRLPGLREVHVRDHVEGLKLEMVVADS